MNIVLTGSSSHLARVLLPALCNHDLINKVTGIDIKPGNFKHVKFIETNLDIRDKNVSRIIQQCDAIIHAAFIVLRSNLKNLSKDRQLVRDINVNGSINVFNSAIENKIPCLIHISSAAVYGAVKNNSLPINEQSIRQVMHGFSYAEDKNILEDWLDEKQNFTTTRIIRFRPHVILGPNAQPFLLQMLRQPFYPYFTEPQPKIQCIWEADVVDAIIKALFSQANGIFNLASQPATSFKEMIKSTHRAAIPVPFALIKTIQNFSWKFSNALEEPGWIDGMQYSLVLDTTKAETELNWKPSKTSLECVIASLKQ